MSKLKLDLHDILIKKTLDVFLFISTTSDTLILMFIKKRLLQKHFKLQKDLKTMLFSGANKLCTYKPWTSKLLEKYFPKLKFISMYTHPK